MEYQSTPFESALGMFFLIMLGVGLFISFISVISMWVLFQKAGKPGWAALIPIYNIIVMLEIVGKPMIWILWLLIPCTSIVFSIWLLNLFVKSYGKSEGFTIGVLFLSFIFLPILAFGNNPYLGPSAAEAKMGFGPNGFGGNNPYNSPTDSGSY
jgi:hypothetical protein